MYLDLRMFILEDRNTEEEHDFCSVLFKICKVKLVCWSSRYWHCLNKRIQFHFQNKRTLNYWSLSKPCVWVYVFDMWMPDFSLNAPLRCIKCLKHSALLCHESFQTLWNPKGPRLIHIRCAMNPNQASFPFLKAVSDQILWITADVALDMIVKSFLSE